MNHSPYSYTILNYYKKKIEKNIGVLHVGQVPALLYATLRYIVSLVVASWVK